MLLYVPDPSFLVAKPLGGIVPAQLLDEFPGATGYVPGEVDGVDALQNNVVGLHGVCASERWGSYMVDQKRLKKANSPPKSSISFIPVRSSNMSTPRDQ